MDKVWGHIKMKGGGCIYGEKYLCRSDTIIKYNTSRNDNYFVLTGLTLLTEKPLMCVVVFSSRQRNNVVETSVDTFVEEMDSMLDD